MDVSVTKKKKYSDLKYVWIQIIFVTVSISLIVNECIG
jgi:hypothetical protein